MFRTMCHKLSMTMGGILFEKVNTEQQMCLYGAAGLMHRCHDSFFNVNLNKTCKGLKSYDLN